MNRLPLIILSAVAVVGLIASGALFAILSAANSYSAGYASASGSEASSPSPLLALVPLLVAVAAGVAALVLWGLQRGQAPVSGR